MSNEVKLNVSQSRGYENVDIKTISSREVAVMMEMTSKDGHSDLMKKIEKINQTLVSEKIPTHHYWIETTYQQEMPKGGYKTAREYQVTKKGCEMLAHKSTGDKGIIFTHKYMERFEQMENHIKQQVPQTYAQALLEAGRLALEVERQQALIEEKNKTISILTHVNKLYTATEIAKELGFKSAVEFNKKLCEDKIQYKANGTYILYSQYSGFGYDSIKQEVLDNNKVIYHRKWTQIGRDFLLKKYGA